LKIEKSGVSKEVLKTIGYINVVGDNVLNWLIGPICVDEIIKKNIELIRKHPLIPKSVSVNGFIVNTETSEFEVVAWL
jgi:carbonic anhydrase